MSITSSIDPELGIVYTTARRGSFGRRDHRYAAGRHRESRLPARFERPRGESRHAPTSDEIRHIADLMVSHHAESGHSKSALVVSNDLSYGFARMYQAMADKSSIETEIFRDMGQARKWLGL